MNITILVIGTIVSLITIITAATQVIRSLKKKWIQDQEQINATNANTDAVEKLTKAVAALDRRVSALERRTHAV